MTWRPDPVLDLYHDGIEPTESAQRGDHAEAEACADRFDDYHDPWAYASAVESWQRTLRREHPELAGWYALGAARAGITRAEPPPGLVPAVSPSGRDQTSRDTP